MLFSAVRIQKSALVALVRYLRGIFHQSRYHRITLILANSNICKLIVLHLHPLQNDIFSNRTSTMRDVKIFSGSSHPRLVESICERLGTQPAECELKTFSNGETSVSIDTSIREQDVFIVQSGSSRINDSVMELLIMISACKSGSAKSITGQSFAGLGDLS